MNNIEKLLEAIMEQANLFLIESGEFAPFATYIRADGKLTYIGAYSETTNSEEMYNMLLDGAFTDLKDMDIRAYAIGLDGTFKGKDVLVVEFILSPVDRYVFKYPYRINGKEVIFEDKI